MSIAWNAEIAAPAPRQPQRLSAETRRTLSELGGLARAAVPIVAVGMMNLAMSFTDMVMMAAYDRDALAAGAIVGDVFSIVIQFAAGALSALSPMVAGARALGADREIGRAIGAGVRLAAILGIVGFFLIDSFTDVLKLAGVALPMETVAETYGWYMAATFAAMTLVALSRSVLPALGRGGVAFYVMAAAVPLNAVANAVFMYGHAGMPEMGLAGAGAASLVVAVFAATTLVLYMVLAPSMRRYGILAGIFDLGLLSAAKLRTALMTGAVALCETGIFLSSTVVVGVFAIAEVPAHVAVFRTVALTYVIATGFAQAVTIKVADAAARSAGHRRRAVRQAATFGTLVLGPVVLVFILTAPELVVWFATGQSVVTEGIRAIAPFAAISAAAIVPAVVAFAVLRATADVAAPTLISLVGYWGVGCPAMMVLAGLMDQGVAGIWMGLAAGTVVTAAGSWLRASGADLKFL